MAASPDRRTFLSASAAGLGGLAFLNNLPAVTAADAKVNPNLVRLDAGIEPLVKLLEDTPREKLLEEVGGRVRKGLAYRDVLAALLLAGVRNVQPRPHVGFKFHAVLVVHSAHLASLSGPDRERWLPLFWALDYFKNAQAQNDKEGGWRMRPVDESKVPPAHKARAALAAALDAWDEEAADVAAAALARSGSAHEAFDLFARFGCRDFRDIGHKAIFVANGFRTLDTIGWQFAEPVLRSLAYALLRHDGENPAKRDLDADRPGRRNAERAAKVRPDWLAGKPAPEATDDVLAATRTGTADDLSEQAVAVLNKGVSPGAVWDGLFVAGGELLMRQPGIVSLHSLTTLNALRYAFQTTANEETRKLLLLQGAAFVPLFREAMAGRGKLTDVRIDKLEAEPVPDVTLNPQAVFDRLSKDRSGAARLALTVLGQQGPRGLIDAGRRLVFLKGKDSHDYKFSAAVMEDYAHLSPAWRDRFLASSVFWLKGSDGPDTPLVARTRAAVG